MDNREAIQAESCGKNFCFTTKNGKIQTIGQQSGSRSHRGLLRNGAFQRQRRFARGVGYRRIFQLPKNREKPRGGGICSEELHEGWRRLGGEILCGRTLRGGGCFQLHGVSFHFAAENHVYGLVRLIHVMFTDFGLRRCRMVAWVIQAEFEFKCRVSAFCIRAFLYTFS